METRKMKMKKKATLLPHPLITPPRSGMPSSTGPLPPILRPSQMTDYLSEGVIFQRFYDEMRAASGDASAEDVVFQRFYDELFAASGDGNVSCKKLPQFPYVNFRESSALDAPDTSGQFGIITGYPKSNDISAIPVCEVSALKIDEK